MYSRAEVELEKKNREKKMSLVFHAIALDLVRFLCTWLDSNLGHGKQQRQRNTLGFVVIRRGPCTYERKAMAGTVDHGFCCCIAFANVDIIKKNETRTTHIFFRWTPCGKPLKYTDRAAVAAAAAAAAAASCYWLLPALVFAAACCCCCLLFGVMPQYTSSDLIPGTCIRTIRQQHRPIETRMVLFCLALVLCC